MVLSFCHHLSPFVYLFTAALRHPVELAELQNESGTVHGNISTCMSDACLMVDDIRCSLSTAVCDDMMKELRVESASSVSTLALYPHSLAGAHNSPF
ncbi:hypothetical protein K438DRAFT_1864316 [Mycena galopus ATCC 62051]|nr:hypothetical protein K438DRAFT_1864316 [Mycena galopus ATCC 62051]